MLIVLFFFSNFCPPGTCRKVCDATNVDSIQSAQRLKGCVVINGSLEIQIRGGGNYKWIRGLMFARSTYKVYNVCKKFKKEFPFVNYLDREKEVQWSVIFARDSWSKIRAVLFRVLPICRKDGVHELDWNWLALTRSPSKDKWKSGPMAKEGMWGYSRIAKFGNSS